MIHHRRESASKTCLCPTSQAAILVNYEVMYNLFATVEFSDGAAAREVSQETGGEIAIVDSAPHMAGLQVLLRPGEGKLFVVRDNVP